MSKKKKQAPQKRPKCGATERLTVAVTRPEDEKELERAVALMYGIDLEADRRLGQREPTEMRRLRKLRNRYHGLASTRRGSRVGEKVAQK